MGIFSTRIKKYHWDWNLQNLLKTPTLARTWVLEYVSLSLCHWVTETFLSKYKVLLDVFEKSFTSCNTYWQLTSCYYLEPARLLIRNGILLPKLFWPTVRKKNSSDQEKLLKFEAEGWEFAKFLRTIYSNSDRSEQFWVKHAFLFCSI